MRRIALVHAMQGSIAPTRRAFDTVWPEAICQNLVDDMLSVDVGTTGLNVAMDKRFLDLLQYSRSCDVDGVLFTCSAFGSCIEKAKLQHSDIPVLKPNEAMMEEAVEAVQLGGRLGVLSVFEPTVPSITRELEDIANARQVQDPAPVEIVAEFIPGALDLLRAGEEEAYNTMVADAAARMHEAHHVDVMVLAMFSMACCGPAVQARLGHDIPTLTSPESAVRKMKMLLDT